MTPTRRLHRVLGACLMLPFFAWAATAAIFFIKPGYGPAYAGLAVKTYPLGDVVAPAPDPTWKEVRLLRTVLGVHQLVRTADGRAHLTGDGAPWPADAAAVRTLLEDAIAGQARYGRLTDVEPAAADTSTGVHITVDWDTLVLYQSGRDTRRINWFYKIHYLQWTGVDGVDRVVGMAGLAMLVLLALSGARLLLGRG